MAHINAEQILNATNAYRVGLSFSDEIFDKASILDDEDKQDVLSRVAFTLYRTAVAGKRFSAGVAASVCFVAGLAGRDFPIHDERVASLFGEVEEVANA